MMSNQLKDSQENDRSETIISVKSKWSSSSDNSQISAASDRSKELPLDLRREYDILISVKSKWSSSPENSQISAASDWSKGLPPNLRGEYDIPISVKSKWSSSPENSQISAASDRSKELPQNFRGEYDIPISELTTRLLAEDQFRCSLCKDVLKDPVIIPCGHSYCRQCITSHWEQPSQEGVYTCLQCSKTYSTCPELYINDVVVQMLHKAKFSPVFPAHLLARPGDVACDICTGRKLRAVKTCQTCITSYCETHIKQHYTVPALRRHSLVEATQNRETWLCPKHHKVLEVFCETDGCFICSLCALFEHKGHDIKMADCEEPSTQSPKHEPNLNSATVLESDTVLGSPIAGTPFPQMTTPPPGIQLERSWFCSHGSEPSKALKRKCDVGHRTLKDKRSVRRIQFDGQDGQEDANGKRDSRMTTLDEKLVKLHRDIPAMS